MIDPLTVACPDCHAPEGVPCATYHDREAHATRVETAEIRASLEEGTCDLCGQRLVRYTRNGTVTVLHPSGDDAVRCPPMADPVREWNTYAAQVNELGWEPGRPGAEHFRLGAPIA